MKRSGMRTHYTEEPRGWRRQSQQGSVIVLGERRHEWRREMRSQIFCIAITAAASLASAQVQRPVVIPPSSIERPEDVGERMHTNYFMFAPDKNFTPDTALPPSGGTETPG